MCNVWNWFDGPAHIYKGSSTITFYGNGDGYQWSAELGIGTDEGEPGCCQVNGRAY